MAPESSPKSAIPADFAARAQEYRDKLVEAVAESDEKLMEKFFDSGSLTDEEIIAGLKKQVAEGKIYPVLYTSATGEHRHSAAAECHSEPACPTPSRAEPSRERIRTARKSSGRSQTASRSPHLYSRRFRIRSPDAFRCFACYSGTLTTEIQPYNVNKSVTERFGSIVLLQGKTQVAVPKLHAGDIARGREAERNADGRHARRQSASDHLSGGEVDRARDFLRDRTEVPR